MTAFSFKRRFVVPIALGLGVSYPIDLVTAESMASGDRIKRQTIRAERKDKRRPKIGSELQLYYGMRTRQCYLIGRARCTDVKSISIYFNPVHPIILIGGSPYREDLTRFSQADGFGSWKEMRQFWEEEHPGIVDFLGFITYWEPLPVRAEKDTAPATRKRAAKKT